MNILMIILLILIGVLLFGFVIFFHEFGHFFTAKLCGIKVNEFALGMGPKLFSFKKGETKYALRLLPIGGYCAMEGEDEDSEDSRAFNNKPVWQRIIVVASGAILNIILGFILIFIMMSFQDTYATTQIADFTENSALQAAGIEVGDEITRIDGYAVYTDRDLSFGLALANPDSVDLEVKRDGEIIKFDDIKMSSQTTDDGKKIVALDFYVLGKEQTFGSLVYRSFTQTFSMSRMVIESLKGIITGRFGLNEIAGPVGTAQVISQAASEGLKSGFGDAVGNIVMIIILITVNLGIVNLLPLPALDGGRLLFLLIELVSRKQVPQKCERYVHTAGFLLLMVLIVVITFNDIIRLVTG